MSRQQRGQNNSMSASNRQNEYFVPRDGIDREVITADICRYLGNDALVRPGNYEADGRVIQGYYITAYRNLTSAMIADLKADSARWDQERRKHSMGGGTKISRDPSEVFMRSSNSPIARYGDPQYRDQRQAGFSGSSGMGSYDSAPRYPGSDAPGYSAGGAPGFGSQPYGTSQGFSAGSGHFSQQPNYSAQSSDNRYAGASAGAPYSQGYGGQQQTMQDAPYVQGSNFVTQVDPYRQDVRMADAGSVQSSRPFQPASSQAPYSSTAQGGGFPYQAQSSTQAGASYTAQPVDAFYGRGAYTTTPTTQASSDFVASPATNQIGYNPAPPEQQYEDPTPRPSRATASSSSTQAQMGNSGSSNTTRRERSDRDREDRAPSDKYSHSSSRHHRRG